MSGMTFVPDAEALGRRRASVIDWRVVREDSVSTMARTGTVDLDEAADGPR
jgi:hypothetical protein